MNFNKKTQKTNVKNLITKIIKSIFSISSLFVPVKRNKITFIRRSFSGSNVTPVYEKILKNHPNIDVSLFDFSPTIGDENLKDLIRKTRIFLDLFRSKIIVTTHGAVFKTKRNTTIDLWHGFPTKKAGLFLNDNDHKKFVKNIDYFLSYSDFSTLLYNSRYGMSIQKYVVLGAPRNDYLFEPKYHFFQNNYKKLIVYSPTYRNIHIDDLNDILNFRFEKFSIYEFNNFLRENNYLLIIKLHPDESNKISKKEKKINYSNISLITDDLLRQMEIDFYNLLATSDLLITDYSSIYADYLLIDKPIIFVYMDLKKYEEKRGLLLNPYELWMPGPKCVSQENLQNEIKKSLEDNTYFNEERKFLKEIFHRYHDGLSTDRVIEFIMSRMEN